MKQSLYLEAYPLIETKQLVQQPNLSLTEGHVSNNIYGDAKYRTLNTEISFSLLAPLILGRVLTTFTSFASPGTNWSSLYKYAKLFSAACKTYYDILRILDLMKSHPLWTGIYQKRGIFTQINIKWFTERCLLCIYKVVRNICTEMSH